jgi:hypothetical protein
MIDVRKAIHFVCLVALLCGRASAQSFEDLKLEGARRSTYQKHVATRVAEAAPKPSLEIFRNKIQPVLAKACFECHGPDKQKGDLRIDTLNADLFSGDDVDWWLEVLAVLTNGEMPPEDDVELADDDRARVIEWLAAEIQTASSTRRATAKHSSFRRMTRYEYNYALQDLLGLPFDFAEDLPPDPTSEEGFQNSSEVLHLSSMQFRAYLDSSRRALQLATVSGERPELLHWGVSMKSAATIEWKKQGNQLKSLRKKHKDEPEKLEAELAKKEKGFVTRPNGVHYFNPETGHRARQSWGYNGAKFAWAPTKERVDVPSVSQHIAVVPPQKNLIVELGDQLPEKGTLRVRVRAFSEQGSAPGMQLLFGWQASNDSSASFRISDEMVVVDAPATEPRFYQWDVPLSQIYPRNLVRKTAKMGGLPSPSEYLKIVNSSMTSGDIHIDYVEVTAPYYEQWPPASHTQIFGAKRKHSNESAHAHDVLTQFMSRAWRREATDSEVKQKVRLFRKLRRECDSFEDAMIETLAAVLASPNFLYVVSSVSDGLSDQELATRLSMFLWCSTPDTELQGLAADGQLRDADIFAGQVQRMLADVKARRLSKHFVRQWLNLELLDFLHVDRKAFPRFNANLREAMAQEPVAFFHEVMQRDHSALEFLHASFTMSNERLAKHYGFSGVTGEQFRRVELPEKLISDQGRGGLLTQAGLLAMNSDGVDSHPLKRGVWMLERLLNDPPPPPPPAVPEIDLADPEIAKMTLKQRIENHRDDPACMSCHAKIDPWGIAFENFDAVGRFRTKVQGKQIDAVSVLFNKQELAGADGLKRFLLEHRQDQFVRALVSKLTTFALGRPLTFADRAAIDEITAQTRKQGDGLATMITSIATSQLFQSK